MAVRERLSSAPTNAMDVRERLPSAPTLSNTLKHLIPNVCIAKNYCLKPSQLHDHFESCSPSMQWLREKGYEVLPPYLTH